MINPIAKIDEKIKEQKEKLEMGLPLHAKRLQEGRLQGYENSKQLFIDCLTNLKRQVEERKDKALLNNIKLLEIPNVNLETVLLAKGYESELVVCNWLLNIIEQGE